MTGIETTNPTTGKVISRYARYDQAEVTRRLARAWAGFEESLDTTPLERAELLRRLAEQLDDRRDELARRATLEMGKPLRQARAEIEKCAWGARHYADNGAAYLTTEHVETEATRSYVRFDPVGPIFAIMPWNYPYWQVLRHAVPAASAGNVVLLKHAENVLGVAHAIEELFTSAGFPEAFLQLLLVSHDQAAEVIADERVRGVTLTGSVRAGAAVGAEAGSRVKKTVLELGGSDAFVVLDDADIETAARVGARSRMQNTGQSCIAAKRFIVDAGRHDDFVDALRAEMEAMTVGDPMLEETDVGPLARADLRQDLHDQVQRARDDGAKLVCGGEIPDGDGWYYPATILTEVSAASPVAQEETFGPVAAILRTTSDNEAIALANSSPLGLGASIWTGDLGRGEHIAGRIDAGIVGVNEMVRSDPRLPFGGVKESGYGRELGVIGAREFTNQRTVWVA